VSEPTEPASPGGTRSDERSDRSPWNWLLIVPIVVPLLTFLYNGDEPRLFGFPRYYWMQIAFIFLGVLCTAVVYRMTKKRRDP
jgi:uncharacterized membrane protein YhdT